MKTSRTISPKIDYTTLRKHTMESGETGERVETAPPALRIRNILVPVDFSETSFMALHYAVAFAKQFEAAITLFHVVGPATYPEEWRYIGLNETERCESAMKRLKALAERETLIGLRVEKIVATGIAFDAIVEYAKKMGADLIIATSHGLTGWKHAIMGSTAERIVRYAPCPILVVRNYEHERV